MKRKYMRSNGNLTQKQYSELFEYAHSVLKENPKCSAIMRWTRDHQYQLEDFFIAYTFVKYGKNDEKSYRDVLNIFREKHKIELDETYNQRFHHHRLWYQKDSPLFQSILQHIEQNNNVDHEIKAELKI